MFMFTLSRIDVGLSAACADFFFTLFAILMRKVLLFLFRVKLGPGHQGGLVIRTCAFVCACAVICTCSCSTAFRHRGSFWFMRGTHLLGCVRAEVCEGVKRGTSVNPERNGRACC